ncbi:MAG TPA: hypothetical protein VHQ20_01445 [Patescibacteria group bacterium]|jgi:5-bromo-4-chloroindolyl phosphate hydrolysis protein|nr:hypothetical protein [Patescibacteria group bacterium]
MNNLTLVDIFFIITGSAVVIITIMLAIALVYIISFVRTIKQVARTAQRATELVTEDISNFRENIHKNGLTIGAIGALVKGLIHKKSSRKK